MKTSELSGAELDMWVAKAEEKLAWISSNGKVYTEEGWYSPSTDWSQGGPLIQREFVTIYPETYTSGDLWFASPFSGTESFEGETPLIAAMRCLVASKFGNEVPDEETKA